MRELINSKNLPFGETETGREWCIKALHPADPITTANGIPDASSCPSVFQNYQMSYNLQNPNPTAIGNWDADVFFYPHPYLIGAVRTVDASNSVQICGITNPQIDGATASAKANTFTQLVERYRLAYMSVTAYHNASAVANNGLLAAAQYMATPNIVTNVPASASNSRDAPSWRYSAEVETWPDPLRTFENLQSMPNAYVGAAREGVYCPFRLSETCQEWKKASHRRQSLGISSSSTLEGAFIAAPNEPATLTP